MYICICMYILMMKYRYHPWRARGEPRTNLLRTYSIFVTMNNDRCRFNVIPSHSEAPSSPLRLKESRFILRKLCFIEVV